MAMPALHYAANKTPHYEQRQLDLYPFETACEPETRSLKSHLQLVNASAPLTQVDLPAAISSRQLKRARLLGSERQQLVQGYAKKQTPRQKRRQSRQSLKSVMATSKHYINEHSWLSDIGVTALLIMPYLFMAR